MLQSMSEKAGFIEGKAKTRLCFLEKELELFKSKLKNVNNNNGKLEVMFRSMMWEHHKVITRATWDKWKYQT